MSATSRQVQDASAPPSGDALRAAAVRTLAVDDQTARVIAALEARGVPTLLLKGPAMARHLYTGDGERFYGDTDLLVAPPSLADARQTLRELGTSRASVIAARR